ERGRGGSLRGGGGGRRWAGRWSGAGSGRLRRSTDSDAPVRIGPPLGRLPVMAQAQQGAVRPGDRPSVRARLAGATAALGVLLTLGACSPAASPEPAPTTTASSPSPTPSPEPTLGETAEPSPEPSPSPTDPNDRSELLVEPEEMENVDEEGAVAAAKYFMGLFEYVFL